MSDSNKSKVTREQLRVIEELLSQEQPPWRELAPDEFKQLCEAGKVLASKAEAYYVGLMRGRGEPRIIPVAVIVGATVGSTAGAVVSVIVTTKITEPEPEPDPEP